MLSPVMRPASPFALDGPSIGLRHAVSRNRGAVPYRYASYTSGKRAMLSSNKPLVRSPNLESG